MEFRTGNYLFDLHYCYTVLACGVSQRYDNAFKLFTNDQDWV